jgi:hypothetical protein
MEKPNVFNDNVVGEIRGASCHAEGMFSRTAPDYEEVDPRAGFDCVGTVKLSD